MARLRNDCSVLVRTVAGRSPSPRLGRDEGLATGRPVAAGSPPLRRVTNFFVPALRPVSRRYRWASRSVTSRSGPTRTGRTATRPSASGYGPRRATVSSRLPRQEHRHLRRAREAGTRCHRGVRRRGIDGGGDWTTHRRRPVRARGRFGRRRSVARGVRRVHQDTHERRPEGPQPVTVPGLPPREPGSARGVPGVKRAAAERHPEDLDAYTDAKSDFVRTIVEQARAEGYDQALPEFV